MSLGAGFDLVAQDEVGAGVTSSGGGEVFTQLRDRGSSPPGRQGVQPDGQHAVVGVDVSAAGEGLADEGCASWLARAYPVWMWMARWWRC